MALRNQPYIPLYVQDYLTDEKLMECSASANGIYIRLLCVMHKSEEYGTILLKQKDKQTDKQIKNFAVKLARHFPYPLVEIEAGLIELLNEGVIQIDNDKLLQKRMIRDNQISIKRSVAGKKGGFATTFAKAKYTANTENESESEIVGDNKDVIKRIINYMNKTLKTNYKYSTKATVQHINARLEEGFTADDFYLVIEKKARQWMDDSRMAGYLRPITLFSTKFESYLNEITPREKTDFQKNVERTLQWMSETNQDSQF